jgi:radical SAM protein with 4Fe4S-binding SPASM domain
LALVPEGCFQHRIRLSLYNINMKYYLAKDCALKLLEAPCAYHMGKDELYELDGEAFEFLRGCASGDGCEVGDGEFADYCIREGILTAEKTAVRRPPVAKSPEPSLRYLELQITRKCNLGCRHCYLGRPRDAGLSLGEIRQVLGEFEAMQGLRLLLTGGEPLLHPEFDGINRLLPDYAFRKVLFTNGTLVTDRLLEGLNVDELQVSVDGLEEAHDALRGRGTFRKAMQCIKKALNKGFEVSVSTMVHAENLLDFDGMERTFKAMGIRDWAVDVPCNEGNLMENPSFHLPPETAGRYLAYGFGEGLHGGGEGFACGLHLMSVTADGSCAKCAFYSDDPVGHIREGLSRCWQRVKHTCLDELKCDCDELDACRGGCRYRAALLGDNLGKDLYRCALYGKL